MTGDPLITRPARDLIEVSVFGPGYGEAVLVHCGDDQWLAIDSCVDIETGIPAPLHYLAGLGVDPAVSLRLILASHWHDDHIRGIGALVEAAPGAVFACSAALHEDQFLALVATHSEPFMMAGSGLDEFNRILDFKKTQKSNRAIRFAKYNSIVWRGMAGTREVQVIGLSPSDENADKAIWGIGSLVPEPYTPKRRVVPLRPNHAAVALIVSIGNSRILLGSDLEEANGVGGWSAIIESPDRPPGKASFLKIPHHGSANAHEPRMWQEILAPSPVSVVSPFARGGEFLPTVQDVKMIRSLTCNGHITSQGQFYRKQRYPKAVEKTLKDVAPKMHSAQPMMGQVRYRHTIDSVEFPQIEHFGNASPLAEYAQIMSAK